MVPIPSVLAADIMHFCIVSIHCPRKRAPEGSKKGALPALDAAIIDEPDAGALNNNNILPILPKNNNFTLGGPILYCFIRRSNHALEGSLKRCGGKVPARHAPALRFAFIG
jgi:hypothetical protein